mgnify:CR=1 FL=1
MKKREILSLVLVTALVFSGCSPAGAGVSESPASEADAAGGEQSPSSAGTPVSTLVSTSDMFTDRDMEIGYDEETSVRIALSGDSASCGSDAVEISGSTVTVTEEGTYILSGTLNDGMIVVKCRGHGQDSAGVGSGRDHKWHICGHLCSGGRQSLYHYRLRHHQYPQQRRRVRGSR